MFLKAARLAPCWSGFKENHYSGVDEIRTIWNMEGQGKELALKTCLCSPYFCLGCNCCNQLQAPSFKMMLSNYPSISTSWRTIPKSNFCELLPRLYCGICISNLFWMDQHEHVLCHPAHSWAHPCSELVKAARNLCFFFPVLPEILTPEQITKYKGIFETFDEYLKHISNTEPRVQVSLWNECVLYLEKINSKRNPPIRQLVLKIEMERFTKPQKQSLQVSWSPPPQKCPVSSVSFPVCSCETTQSISLHALLSWHLPSPWGTWATVQRFVLSSFLDSWCSQKKRNYRGCSVSLAGIPPSTPAWETSVLEQQLPVCTVLSVYSQGGKILLTFFIAGHKEQFFYQKMNKHSRPTFTGIFKPLPFYLISYPWRSFTRGLQQSQKTFLLTDHYKGMRRNIFPS